MIEHGVRQSAGLPGKQATTGGFGGSCVVETGCVDAYRENSLVCEQTAPELNRFDGKGQRVGVL